MNFYLHFQLKVTLLPFNNEDRKEKKKIVKKIKINEIMIWAADKSILY